MQSALIVIKSWEVEGEEDVGETDQWVQYYCRTGGLSSGVTLHYGVTIANNNVLVAHFRIARRKDL